MNLEDRLLLAFAGSVFCFTLALAVVAVVDIVTAIIG